MDYLNDTWVFDTTSQEWTEIITTTQPEVRSGHAMCYIGNDKILLFAGSNWVADIVYFGDVWEFDLSTEEWTEITTTNTPGERDNVIFDYSESNQKVIAFGGYVSGIGQINETWELDVSTSPYLWTEIDTTTKPDERSLHRMVNIDNGNFILFGGYYREDSNSYFLNDTWHYQISVSE